MLPLLAVFFKNKCSGNLINILMMLLKIKHRLEFTCVEAQFSSYFDGFWLSTTLKKGNSDRKESL